MRVILIRDLETGEVLKRSGATALEILKQKERFCEKGSEPKGWKPSQKEAA